MRHRRTKQETQELKEKIWGLASRGVPYKQIARECKIDPSLTRRMLANILASREETDEQIVRGLILKMKREDRYSSAQIRYELQQNYRIQNPPSESTIDVITGEEGLNKLSPKEAKRRPYWEEARPSHPLDMIQIDTVEMQLPMGGKLGIFTAIDVVSRITWAEVIGDTNYAWVLSRIFQALGTPKILQSDNGFGMVLPRRHLLSAYSAYALQQGVERVQFIPVAEPQRNGQIERFHGTLRNRWNNTYQPHDDPNEWLNEFLHWYNTRRIHSTLGGKTNRKCPAQAGEYNHLPPVTGERIAIDQRIIVGGTISYKRLVLSSGIATVNAPAMIFALSPALWGRYVRIDLHLGGRGEVWLADHTADKPIATFSHLLGTTNKEKKGNNGFIRCKMSNEFAAPKMMPFEERDLQEKLRRHLRQAHPRIVPAPFEVVHQENGWHIVNTMTGEIMLSEETGYSVEHAEVS